MPYYTCSNAACSSGGAAFSLGSAGQKFCPRCNTAGALTAAATPVVAPASQTRTIQDSNQMDTVGKDMDEVGQLIDKWDLNSVSGAEANKTHDCVFKLGQNRAKRIDREGPITGPDGEVTHAKFRLQFGSKTYGGLRIKIDETLDAATIKRGLRESVAARRYVEVYLG